MSDRPGCLGSLLSIPLRLLNLDRGRRLLTQRAAPPVGLQAAEKDALTRARQAAAQCRSVLHGAGAIDASVLDQVSGSVDALLDQIDALAQRIAAARQWLSVHDPERISRQLVELEVSPSGSVVDQMKSLRALKEQSRHAAAIQAGLPGLAGKLTAAALHLEALSARLMRQQLDAAGLIADLEQQKTQTGQAVSAWQATVAEIGGLQ